MAQQRATILDNAAVCAALKTDTRALRDDPDLKGEWYEGEYVISQETIYLITSTGQVDENGATQAIFSKV